MLNLLPHTSSPATSDTSLGGRNHDYRQEYSPDKSGEEAQENARVWKVYLNEAKSHDIDMIQGYQETIGSHLVFAALFSAVVTTFVVQTSQALQPDNSQIMVSLLFENNQLLRAAGNKTSINAVVKSSLGPESRTYTSMDLWMNGFFFTSLAISLSAALMCVFVKQCFQVYATSVPGDAATCALTHQYRLQGLEKYKFDRLIDTLPLFLYTSVGLFNAGVLIYISQWSNLMALAFLAIIIPILLFYAVSCAGVLFDVAWPYHLIPRHHLAQLSFLAFYHRNSLMEQYQLPNILHTFHLVQTSLAWLFNYSSNHSVKEIVIESTCGLLNNLPNQDPSDLHSSKLPISTKLFSSAILYSSSRLSHSKSSAEERTLYVQLIQTFTKLFSIKALLDEPTFHSVEYEQMMDGIVLFYAEAVSKKDYTLSHNLLHWTSSILCQPGNQWRMKFLIKCAKFGNAEDLTDLIDQGIDLDNQDSNRWSAMHYAASCGNLDIVIALVERKPALMSVGVTFLGTSSWTALDLAIHNGSSDTIRYLLDNGAKSLSHNALHTAIAHPGLKAALEKIECLLNHEWDRTIKDTEGKTLLNVAQSKHDTALINHLENYQTVKLPPYEMTSHAVDEEAPECLCARSISDFSWYTADEQSRYIPESLGSTSTSNFSCSTGDEQSIHAADPAHQE